MVSCWGKMVDDGIATEEEERGPGGTTNIGTVEAELGEAMLIADEVSASEYDTLLVVKGPDPTDSVVVEPRVILDSAVLATRGYTGLLMRSGSAIGTELAGIDELVTVVPLVRFESAIGTAGTVEVVANVLTGDELLNWLL